jgi:hypothetical protein
MILIFPFVPLETALSGKLTRWNVDTRYNSEDYEKNSENRFPSKIYKLLVPSESSPQELSNEWSC